MPLTAETSFTYNPLNPRSGIRFIVLHPGHFSSPIEVNVLHMPLPHNLPFEALSYTWGDHSTLRKIAVRGRKRCFLHITENLESALQHLRYPDKKRLLWIDALCINQGDRDERSSQVMRMGEIYSRARNVCIWLGEATDRSDEALDFVYQVSHLGKLDKLIKDPGVVNEWRALAALMRRPWFSRRWVIQEVAFARTATVYCGTKMVKWLDLSDAITLFGDKFNDICLLFEPSREQRNKLKELHLQNKVPLGNIRGIPAYTLVTTLNYIIRKAYNGRVIQRLCTMEMLISSVALSQVTDPKDTVYALWALASDAKPISEQEIDYSKDLRQIFKDLINHTVNLFGSLDIICRPWAPVSSTLPSWVPQMSRHAFSALDGQRINADSLVGPPNRPIYNAGGHISRAHALFNEDGKGFILKVVGFQLDTIFSVEEPAADGVIPGRWIDMGMSIADLRPDWPIDDTVERTPTADVFWRTLVADRGDDGNPSPGWYHRAWEACYRRCNTDHHKSPDLDTQYLIQNPLDDDNSSTITSFLRRVQSVTWNRRLVTTEKISLGIVPEDAEETDIVCILSGCSVPVILRPHEDGFYEFIGECYINGITAVMDGHAANEAIAGKYDIVEFFLK
jgi:Heterokaryon incompatibility protein (HET)